MIRAPAEVGPFLTEYDRYLVVGHMEPDGDCVASAVAMARFLERRGKTVVLADQGPFDRPEVAGFQSLFRVDAPRRPPRRGGPPPWWWTAPPRTAWGPPWRRRWPACRCW